MPSASQAPSFRLKSSTASEERTDTCESPQLPASAVCIQGPDSGSDSTLQSAVPQLLGTCAMHQPLAPHCQTQVMPPTKPDLQAAPSLSASASAAPAPSQSGLPPGWLQATDLVYNHPYYYNPSTGERLWEPPAGSSTPSASQPTQVCTS